MALLDKIKDRSAVIGVVGLGYVGLPLAVLQAKTGFRVHGIDEVGEKVNLVNDGKNYILDVDNTEMREMVKAKRLSATSDFSILKECDMSSRKKNSPQQIPDRKKL